MAMTKLFLPIKLPLVAFLVPRVAQRLRKAGFDFGKQKYSDIGRDVKDRVKERASEARERVREQASELKDRTSNAFQQMSQNKK